MAKLGEGAVGKMLELGRQELIAANSGQPIEPPQPQTFENIAASPTPVVAKSNVMER